MDLENEIQAELKNKGAGFIHFVNISNLSSLQNKGFPNAILIGIVLSPGYIQKIIETPDYVKNMVREKQTDRDEFHITEAKTDRLADELAAYLREKGFAAYSQSEDNIYLTGFYDTKNHITPLPHKTIAGMAGLGWIGKHNLFVHEEYGSAFSMCTVLTDAPLPVISKHPKKPQCDGCSICTSICTENAIKGVLWDIEIPRDKIVDVHLCTTCLKCLAFCPWTINYVNKNLKSPG